MSRPESEDRVDEQGRTIPGDPKFVFMNGDGKNELMHMMNTNHPAHDGFLVYRSPDDGRLFAVRASNVTFISSRTKDEGGGTSIFVRPGGFLLSDEPVDILARRLNHLLGTADIEGERRYSPDMAPARRPNFAGEILR
jgi:hypothetical protein